MFRGRYFVIAGVSIGSSSRSKASRSGLAARTLDQSWIIRRSVLIWSGVMALNLGYPCFDLSNEWPKPSIKVDVLRVLIRRFRTATCKSDRAGFCGVRAETETVRGTVSGSNGRSPGQVAAGGGVWVWWVSFFLGRNQRLAELRTGKHCGQMIGPQ